MVKRLPTMQETQVQSLGWEHLPEKKIATHSSTLAWKSHGRRSQVGYNPQGHKESDTTERLHFHFHSIVKRAVPSTLFISSIIYLYQYGFMDINFMSTNLILSLFYFVA